MEEKITHIYDKIFKKILTMSQKAVINLINGLYGTNHSLDSEITYHWTESIDNNLRRTLADTIITINDFYNYHIEAQMYQDEDIVLRVFEYGFGHSVKYNRDSATLRFPAPRVIFFCEAKDAPDFYTLNLDFEGQGKFEYRVKTFKYQDYTVEDINKMKMIVLIPFELLKFRELLKKEHTEDNLNTLKSLVKNDILGSIQTNYSMGNITGSDARRLIQLTIKLYSHLYSEYNTEVIEEMDESLILEYDHLEKRYENLDKRQAELDKKQETLKKSEAKLRKSEAKLRKSEAKLRKSEAKLKKNEAELKKNEAELKKNEAELKKNEDKLKKNEDKLRKSLEEKDEIIKKLKEELEKIKVPK